MTKISIETVKHISDNVAVVTFSFEGPRRSLRHPKGYAVARWSTRYKGRALVGDLGTVLLDGDDPGDVSWDDALALATL